MRPNRSAADTEVLRSFTDDLLSCPLWPRGEAKYKLLTQAAQAKRCSV